MVKSKVILEIRFEKSDVPKKVLEDLVLGLAEKKKEFTEPLKDIDPKVNVRVWYEGLTREYDVNLPSIARMFRKR